LGQGQLLPGDELRRPALDRRALAPCVSRWETTSSSTAEHCHVLLRVQVSEKIGHIRFAYDQQKASELAAHFLLVAGGSMPMLKLLKLMYHADRTSLIETGFPVTGDTIVAMDNGPVLSKTYDHLKPTGSLEYIRSEPGDV